MRRIRSSMAWALAGGLAVATPGAARASEPEASDAAGGRAYALELSGTAGNPGYGGALGARLRLRRGIAVGAELGARYAPEAFIGGFSVANAVVTTARLPLLLPVLRQRALTMAITLAPGVRSTRSLDADAPERAGLSITLDAGAHAYLRLHERLTWRAGIDVPVSIQLDPIVDNDVIGALLVTGPVVPINDRVGAYLTVEAGGLFGSDGDAGKFLLRGTTGLRFTFGASARRWRAF